MPDLEDDAFQIAKFMYESKFVGSNAIAVSDLRRMLPLSSEDFDAADNFLLEGQYCSGTMGGDAGIRILKSRGVAFVKTRMAEKLEAIRESSNPYNSSNPKSPDHENGIALNLAHANNLYSQVMLMCLDWSTVDHIKAQLIIEYARDAIEAFGKTNQERKVDLKRVIETAEQIISPESIDSLKKRVEKVLLRFIYPRNTRLRNTLLLITCVATVVTLVIPVIVQFRGITGPATPTDATQIPVPNQIDNRPEPDITKQSSEQLQRNELLPKPELKVVDVSNPEPNIVDFKLKNSGDDSAFLKSIRFVFNEGTAGCDGCMPQKAFVYVIEARVKNKVIIIKPQYVDKKSGRPLKKPELHKIDDLSTDQKLKNKLIAENIEMMQAFRERAKALHESPPLKISQVVPPRGVDRFQVKFNAPKLKQDKESKEGQDKDGLSNPYTWDSFRRYYIFHGFAIIEFDENGKIQTPIFEITIRE